MSALDKILTFLKPFVAQGRTRFLMAVAGIGTIGVLAKFAPETDRLIFCLIAGIVGLYIIAKTINDLIGNPNPKSEEKKMGFNLFGALKGLITVGTQVYGLLKPGGGQPAPKVTYDLALEFALTNIFPQVRRVIQFGNLNTKEKIDGYLDTLDATTGTDVGALDIIKTLPDTAEEALFDHLKEAIRIYAYNLAKIPGYYTGEVPGSYNPGGGDPRREA